MKCCQRTLLLSLRSSHGGTRGFMTFLRLVLAASTILFCVTPEQSQAHLMEAFTYQELLAKSDLVVIATPKSETTDTAEQAFFPNLVREDKDGRRSKVESIGVETIFVVAAVLKGDKTIKKLTLHHYREVSSSHVMVNRPLLVFF